MTARICEYEAAVTQAVLSRQWPHACDQALQAHAGTCEVCREVVSIAALLREDYDDAREMYRDYLEYAGFQVETARDGHEALVKARASNPDLILMDLSLPGLDGWEATRMLKTDPATSHLIVVALSAHALSAEGEALCDLCCAIRSSNMPMRAL